MHGTVEEYSLPGGLFVSRLIRFKICPESISHSQGNIRKTFKAGMTLEIAVHSHSPSNYILWLGNPYLEYFVRKDKE